MEIQPKEWWTLEEYAVSLFEANQTNTPEFEFLINIFGRPRLAEMWERYQTRKSLTDKARKRLSNPVKGAKDGNFKV